MNFKERWEMWSKEERSRFKDYLYSERDNNMMVTTGFIRSIIGCPIYTMDTFECNQIGNAKIYTIYQDGNYRLGTKDNHYNRFGRFTYFPEYNVMADYPFSSWIFDVGEVDFKSRCITCTNMCFISGMEKCDFYSEDGEKL